MVLILAQMASGAPRSLGTEFSHRTHRASFLSAVILSQTDQTSLEVRERHPCHMGLPPDVLQFPKHG
mgnify:CR=1 FL=1